MTPKQNVTKTKCYLYKMLPRQSVPICDWQILGSFFKQRILDCKKVSSIKLCKVIERKPSF